MQKANTVDKTVLLSRILKPLVQRLATTLNMGAAVLSCDGTIIASCKWSQPCATPFCLPSAGDCFHMKIQSKTASEPLVHSHVCTSGFRFESAPIMAAHNQIANLLIGPFCLSPQEIPPTKKSAAADRSCPRRQQETPLISAQQHPLVLAHLETTAELIGMKLEFNTEKRNEQSLRESQGHLLSFFQAAPLGLIVSHNKNIIKVNKRFCEITGYTPEELVNQSARRFYQTEQEYERVQRELAHSMWEKGQVGHVEASCLCKDGSIRDIALFAAPIDAANPAAGAAVVIQDITEQKLTEEALRLGRDKLQSLFRAAPIGLAIIRERHFYSVNERLCAITGYEADELILMHVRQLYASQEEYNVVGQALYSTLWQTGRTEIETHFLCKNGTMRDILITMTPIDLENRDAGVAATCQDITQRKKTERALQQHRAMLQGLFNAVPVGLAIIKNRTFSAVNKRLSDMLGYSQAVLRGTSTRKMYENNDEFFRIRKELYGELWRSGKHKYVETRLVRSDGTVRDVSLFAAPIDANDPRDGAAVAIEDITDRKMAEKALRESEFRFRSFYNTNPEGIILLDFQGLVLDANKAFLNDSGYSLKQCIGRHFKDFVDDEEAQARCVEAILTLKAGISNQTPLLVSYKTADSTIVPVAAKGWLVVDEESRPMYIGIFVKNLAREKALSEEKAALEKQIIQSQKSEAIGTLAGGIAHDFNNILGGLLGYAELALLKTPNTEDNQAREYMQRVLEIGLRAKELVQQILRFSRHSKTKMEPVNIGPIIEETVRLLRSTIPTTIEIRQEILAQDDRILGDATQIHQVLMNLATNGYHAMRKGGGILTISLQQVHLDRAKHFHTMEIQAGEYLQLSVQDNGCGIPASVLERIFEPYFTTKVVNEGTGLGLAVTMGIVKDHQGLIDVETAPGGGTCFSVYLPLSSAREDNPQESDSRLAVGHGERIIIVDDEEFFREVIRESLGLLGYEVVAQSSSLQTLHTIKNNPKGFDLLITDQTMPEMTGTQLAQHILAINPFMPIILCTGYSETITEDNASNFGISKLLMKPVNIEELATAVHNVLKSADAKM